MNVPMTLADRVKAKINDQIADLIGADELGRLVDAQLQRFMQNDLNELIRTEITAQMTAAIKAELGSINYAPVWKQHGSIGASEAVKRVISENAGDILASALEGLVANTVQSMRNNMSRY